MVFFVGFFVFCYVVAFFTQTKFGVKVMVQFFDFLDRKNHEKQTH